MERFTKSSTFERNLFLQELINFYTHCKRDVYIIKNHIEEYRNIKLYSKRYLISFKFTCFSFTNWHLEVIILPFVILPQFPREVLNTCGTFFWSITLNRISKWNQFVLSDKLLKKNLISSFFLGNVFMNISS